MGKRQVWSLQLLTKGCSSMRRDRDFEILYKITCIYIHIVKIFNLHLKVIHYALSYNKSYQLLQKIFRKSEIPILRYTKFLPRYTYVYGVNIPQVYGIQYTPYRTTFCAVYIYIYIYANVCWKYTYVYRRLDTLVYFISSRLTVILLIHFDYLFN